MRVTASSAPGKLVLLGEYAVLFGHPAVVMAVNRRAHVELSVTESDHWSVAAPGFSEEEATFDFDQDLGLQWRESTTASVVRFDLVEHVIGSLAAAQLVESKGLLPARMVLDTREFFQSTASGSAKLGLGSSAALTVALTRALWDWATEEKRSKSVGLEQLLELHRSFQGGRGSGIDLAASLNGGVIEYRLSDNGERPSAGILNLPAGLHMVFVWTGRSASTADFLTRLDSGMRFAGGAITTAVAELGRVSATGISHIRSGDVGELLRDIRDFAEAMERLGHEAGIPIFSDEHVKLRELAEKLGVSYKPSGAGGGDVGIGCADDPEAAMVFAERAAAAGFQSLELEIDARGVTSDP